MRRLVLAALALSLLPACDAAERALDRLSPDAGPPGVHLDAGAATPVAELDPAMVCDALYDAVTRQTPPATRCVPAGLIAAQNADEPVTSCTSTVQTCTRLAGLGQQAFDAIPTGPCPFTQADADNCDATLEALQPCLDGLATSAVAQLEETFTCALADDANPPTFEIVTPATDDAEACADLTVACPSFFSGSTGR